MMLKRHTLKQVTVVMAGLLATACDQHSPAGLRALGADLHLVAEGTRPAVVALDTEREDWPADPIVMDAPVVNGDRLSTVVRYSGGCATHDMDLVAYGGWVTDESPVRVHAVVAHDGGGDACEAWISETLTFALTPLIEAYEEEGLQPSGGPLRIVLENPEDRAAPYVVDLVWNAGG